MIVRTIAIYWPRKGFRRLSIMNFGSLRKTFPTSTYEVKVVQGSFIYQNRV
jgi:hypothetical protein